MIKRVAILAATLVALLALPAAASDASQKLVLNGDFSFGGRIYVSMSAPSIVAGDKCMIGVWAGTPLKRHYTSEFIMEFPATTGRCLVSFTVPTLTGKHPYGYIMAGDMTTRLESEMRYVPFATANANSARHLSPSSSGTGISFAFDRTHTYHVGDSLSYKLNCEGPQCSGAKTVTINRVGGTTASKSTNGKVKFTRTGTYVLAASTSGDGSIPTIVDWERIVVYR